MKPRHTSKITSYRYLELKFTILRDAGLCGAQKRQKLVFYKYFRSTRSHYLVDLKFFFEFEFEFELLRSKIFEFF